MKNKVLIGGLIGGIAYFFLGFLIYGVLLDSYTKENCNQCSARPMEEFIWWALILSNLFWAYLLALIFGWTNTSGLSNGAQKGAVIGLLLAASFNFSSYSMTTMYNSMTPLFVEMAASIVMNTIVGGIIGWYYGMGNKTSE